MAKRIFISIGAAALVVSCGSGPTKSELSAQAEQTASPAETQATAKPNPSFDCTKADSEATKLVCTDAELAAMDRELARLYKLAETGSHITPDRKKELTAMQRGWVKGRDDCWKADDKRQCVMTSYAGRIHELRQGYADARTNDATGISMGPVAIACEATDFGVSATFVQTDPGGVYLQWKDSGMALAHVPSGSGAKYEGMWDGAKATLFTKGDDAMLTFPNEPARTCRIEEIG